MPPKKTNSDSRSVTILFKKNKTTILLSLQPHEQLQAVKQKVLQALKERDVREINGDIVPDDPAEIEFGIPIDRSDLEKGWTRLKTNTSNEETEKKSGRTLADTVLDADLGNGNWVAFRFRKDIKPEETKEEETAMSLDLDDPGWDVVVPSFDDEEEGLEEA
ncbi:hypothetical protein N7509_009281 [Penicillium cosmopolitanum]|uniref:Uncharacterized protein n=1 Tax=Penicillium cosmopolitanum TaxID=1131564 RepID=A0A9W9VPA9_9EURO|nr:uncharacterized protein N7509_009281 [Penicillium cosmopolitanum]KAJ5386740.1 hypothetical protein N7509_009281 [Penicillium cosmopolitanum]